MKTIPETAASEALIVETLRSGGVIVCPTDTIYGLSCRADDPEAILKIHRFKGSDPQKPLILLAADWEMVEKYSLLTPTQKSRAQELWAQDRPTSLILGQNQVPAPTLMPSQVALAWRLPKSPFLLKIIKALGVPLVSTSLNKTGQPPLKSLAGFSSLNTTENAPDLLVDGGVLDGQPSRLIDLSGAEEEVIRP
ncbi:MAG: L-threonylcarbamoyladenylate synthase [Candidatus Parcubacteria bacterium]|jgi:tRNA threonylcarbamoyl adenosine modification protein (Sua5/YciO/YrdC/YwlC family)|nr:MAG: L-threonylcarbamoyladenylate synthase [Candidatus Parcubacteria bacterium]